MKFKDSNFPLGTFCSLVINRGTFIEDGLVEIISLFAWTLMPFFHKGKVTVFHRLLRTIALCTVFSFEEH